MKTQTNTRPQRMTSKWSRTILLATAALSLFAVEAQAQIGFAAEGRVGITVPQGDLSDAGAETGLTLGGELQANFHRNLTAYVGLHRHAFGCESGCGLGDSPNSTGIGAGLKYIFHSPGDVHVWGRGGIIANKLNTTAFSGDREIGFEVGVGADLPISPRLSLVPNIGLLSHDTGGNLTARFFTLGVGVHYHIN